MALSYTTDQLIKLKEIYYNGSNGGFVVVTQQSNAKIKAMIEINKFVEWLTEEDRTNLLI